MQKTEIKITQTQALPTEKAVDQLSAWIVVLPVQPDTELKEKLPYIDLLLKRRARYKSKAADIDALTTDLPNVSGSHVSYACVDPDMKPFDLLTLSRKLFAAQQKNELSSLTVTIAGFEREFTERVAEALIATACASSAQMPNYKSKQKKKTQLKEIKLYGIRTRHGFKRTLNEAAGNNLARYLSQLPPNELTPTSYLKIVRKLAKENNWKLEFLDEKILKKKGAGAFLAVVQGSPVPDAGILRLKYEPAKSTSTRKKKLTLIGKGICYDTGGTNLKPAKYMYGMHEDMQGSAVALGTFLALSKQKVNFSVECWLAIAMNHIGPKAYKPNDVIKASDGTTIEVIHTDAEGRMVLADSLALASKAKPDLIIDYATLTGACVYSLGSAYSGVFTNKDENLQTLIQAGRDSGERVWPFPIDPDYDKGLESQIADVKQCALEGDADHILAARFLQRFIKHKIPWIHVDLSSGNRKGGLAHIPTDTTGFGVRYTLNLLLDQNIL